VHQLIKIFDNSRMHGTDVKQNSIKMSDFVRKINYLIQVSKIGMESYKNFISRPKLHSFLPKKVW